MLTKEEFIEKLRENIDFVHTHYAVQELDENIQWTQEEMKLLIDIAAECGQVYGTLDYQANPRVGNFYRDILANYTGVQDENVDKVIKKIMIIANEDIYNYLVEEKKLLLKRKSYFAKGWYDQEHELEVSICDGLYHANSVSTSISFIKNKMLYSRQYGETHFQISQTVQASDASDKLDGVYNDLFFDNCDIRSISGKQSAYGPVSFVMDEKILLDPDSKIRITKMNPGNTGKSGRFGEMPYPERYFTSIEELRKTEFSYPFRTLAGHHTTFWNKESIKLTPDILKYILLERNMDEEKLLEVKEHLEKELAKAGLQEVPVILRPTLPDFHIKLAAPPSVLWQLPE